MNFSKVKKKGFTIIELMITVVVVGILATLAIPAYQDYNIKAQVAEGLSLATGQKTAVAEYKSNFGDFPNSTDLGFNGAMGNYINNVEINNGVILSFFGNDANNLLFAPENTVDGMPPFIGLFPEKINSDGSVDDTPGEKGVIPWTCISSLQAKYLPNGCINVALIAGGGNPGNPGDIDSDNPYDYPITYPNEENLYDCEWGKCANTPEDLGCFQMSNGNWAWWDEVPMYGGGTIKQKGSCDFDGDAGYWFKPWQ